MSNAFDKASLVMLPHAYEDGKLYSLKPTDRSGDFTFSRGSDTATRVNADGNIEKETQNLILQSNNFNSSSDWNNERLTITTGYEGYDGSSDAWKLVPDAANSTHRINQSTSLSGVKTFSVYAKAAGYDYIRIMGFLGNTISWTFDLASGSTISAPNPSYNIDYVFENVGNDWYRLTITSNEQHTNWYVFVYDNSQQNNFSGNGTDGIYIQDAQLNQGLVAQDYLETTTAPVYGGLTDNMPRLDYTDATCPSLLLEPSRTNLVPYSEYFGGWQQASGPIITANATTSPEGVENAYLLTSTQISSRVQVPVSPTGTNIQSVYIKYAGSDARVRISGLASSNSRFEVNVTSSGVVFHSAESGIIDYSIESVGNDWYRVTSTQSGGNYYQISADVTGNNGSIYIYGAQLEQGSYPTSYIPTYGSTQTRAADVLDRGANLAYTGDYTFFAEFELTEIDLYFLTANTASGYNFMIRSDDTLIQFGRTIGTSANVVFTNTTDWQSLIGTTIKIAFYKSGTSFKLFINGTPYTPTTNTLTTGDEVLDWRYINVSSVANRQEQAYIKQLLEFEEALSDAECIALTQN